LTTSSVVEATTLSWYRRILAALLDTRSGPTPAAVFSSAIRDRIAMGVLSTMSSNSGHRLERDTFVMICKDSISYVSPQGDAKGLGQTRRTSASRRSASGQPVAAASGRVSST